MDLVTRFLKLTEAAATNALDPGQPLRKRLDPIGLKELRDVLSDPGFDLDQGQAFLVDELLAPGNWAVEQALQHSLDRLVAALGRLQQALAHFRTALRGDLGALLDPLRKGDPTQQWTATPFGHLYFERGADSSVSVAVLDGLAGGFCLAGISDADPLLPWLPPEVGTNTARVPQLFACIAVDSHRYLAVRVRNVLDLYLPELLASAVYPGEPRYRLQILGSATENLRVSVETYLNVKLQSSDVIPPVDLKLIAGVYVGFSVKPAQLERVLATLRAKLGTPRRSYTLDEALKALIGALDAVQSTFGHAEDIGETTIGARIDGSAGFGAADTGGSVLTARGDVSIVTSISASLAFLGAVGRDFLRYGLAMAAHAAGFMEVLCDLERYGDEEVGKQIGNSAQDLLDTQIAMLEALGADLDAVAGGTRMTFGFGLNALGRKGEAAVPVLNSSLSLSMRSVLKAARAAGRELFDGIVNVADMLTGTFHAAYEKRPLDRQAATSILADATCSVERILPAAPTLLYSTSYPVLDSQQAEEAFHAGLGSAVKQSLEQATLKPLAGLLAQSANPTVRKQTTYGLAIKFGAEVHVGVGASGVAGAGFQVGLTTNQEMLLRLAGSIDPKGAPFWEFAATVTANAGGALEPGYIGRVGGGTDAKVSDTLVCCRFAEEQAAATPAGLLFANGFPVVGFSGSFADIRNYQGRGVLLVPRFGAVTVNDLKVVDGKATGNWVADQVSLHFLEFATKPGGQLGQQGLHFNATKKFDNCSLTVDLTVTREGRFGGTFRGSFDTQVGSAQIRFDGKITEQSQIAGQLHIKRGSFHCTVGPQGVSGGTTWKIPAVTMDVTGGTATYHGGTLSVSVSPKKVAISGDGEVSYEPKAGPAIQGKNLRYSINLDTGARGQMTVSGTFARVPRTITVAL